MKSGVPAPAAAPAVSAASKKKQSSILQWATVGSSDSSTKKIAADVAQKGDTLHADFGPLGGIAMPETGLVVCRGSIHVRAAVGFHHTAIARVPKR